jgi:predicted N-acetyltransferase YhbS
MDSGFRRNDEDEEALPRKTTTMIRIESESPNDILAREKLLDRAMGAGRVLKPSERLREGRLPADGLALVARDGDRLVGSVRLWHVAAGGVPALLLGPLAIDPALQGKGVGGGLMQVALSRAADLGHNAVILVGDPEYYERFGFTRAPVGGLVMPGPVDRRRFLGIDLAAGTLRGAEGRVIATGRPAGGALALAA